MKMVLPLLLSIWSSAPHAVASADRCLAIVGTHDACRTRAPRGPSSVTSREEDFRRWGNRRDSVGTLMNPPRGSVSPQVRQTEAYLRSLIERLAGSRIRDSRIQLTISIYASDEPNAFMRNHPRQQTHIPEPYQAPPPPSLLSRAIRRAFAFTARRSVYELGITTGLLRALTRESEIAFVLGHELTHLFEGHTNPHETIERRWYSSQRFEVVADNQALHMMAGKFNLDGAVSSLRMLANLSESHHPVNAVVSSHHDEGVRIGSAQSYIEYLRRTVARVSDIADTRAPGFVRILAPTRAEFSPQFETLKREFLNTLPEHLGREESWQLRSFNGSDRNDFLDRFTYLQPSPRQLAALLAETTELLNSRTDISPQSRIDTFLRVSAWIEMTFSHSWGGPRSNSWAQLTDSERSAIERFLLRTANQGWSFQETVRIGHQQLTNDVAAQHTSDSVRGTFFYLLQHIFLYAKPAAQSSYHRLASVSPRWNQAISMLTTLCLQQLETTSITSHIRNLSGYKGMSTRVDGALIPRLKRDLIASLRQQIDQLATRVQSDGHTVQLLYPKLIGLATSLASDGNVDHAFLSEVREISAPHVARFAAARDAFAIRYFGSNSFNESELERFIISFWESLETVPITRNLGSELDRAFLSMVETINRRHLLDNVEILDHENSRRYVSRLFNSNRVSEEQKQALLTFIISTTPADVVSEGQLRTTPEIQRRLQRMTGQELFDRLNDFPQSLADIIVQAAEATPPNRERVQNGIRQLTTMRLSPLVLIGLGLSENGWDRRLDRAELLQVLQSIETANQENIQGGGSLFGEDFLLSRYGSRFLLSTFRHRQSQFRDAADWISAFERITKLNSTAIDFDQTLKPVLRARLTQLLELEPPLRLREHLQHPDVLRLLDPSIVARFMVAALDAAVERTDRSVRATEELTRTFIEELHLRAEFPAIYTEFQERWTEHRNVQPARLNESFPSSTQSVTQQTEEFSGHIRGLSAMAAQARRGSFQEQIHFLEYLMGTRPTMPSFVLNIEMSNGEGMESDGRKVALSNLLSEARERIQRQNQIGRAFLANVFLTGPHSITATPELRGQLLEYLLRDIQPANREFARVVGEAVIEAQGVNGSLAFAYVFAQPQTAGENGQAREARVLNSLFTAFGVPGIKFGQYLAFTSELRNYRSALESLQDSANPLSYHQALRLLIARFGSSWPERYRVVRVLGSGSVNVAIEYEHLASGNRGVVTVLRQDLEISIREDFRRFNLMLDSLLRHPRFGPQLSYMRGLSRVIEQSVSLELNKEHSMEMQRRARELYHHQVDGWNIRTVDAYSADSRGFFMERANGKTARRVRQENLGLYRRAMRALNRIEFDLLLGNRHESDGRMVSFFANPDFHDGQVLIDKDTRTIIILDFGQALPIEPTQRELGMNLLRMMYEVDGIPHATRFANRILRDARATGRFSESEMRELLHRERPMDGFVKLIAAFHDRGYDIPMSSIHWILSANRLSSLGERIGVANAAMLQAYIAGHRIGLTRTRLERAREIWERALRWVGIESAIAPQPLRPIPPRSMGSAPSCRNLFSNP